MENFLKRQDAFNKSILKGINDFNKDLHCINMALFNAGQHKREHPEEYGEARFLKSNELKKRVFELIEEYFNQ